MSTELMFWQADSAAAWDKCEERRLECERLRALNAELLTMLRWGIESMTVGERDRWRFEARNVVAQGQLRSAAGG